MSFVSIVAREGFISITSDGRVCDHDMTPIQENYKKFHQITDNFFYAFAGHKQPCEIFIKVSEIEKLHDKNFEISAQEIQKKLLLPPFSQYKILLACGGKDKSGNIGFFTLSTL